MKVSRILLVIILTMISIPYYANANPSYQIYVNDEHVSLQEPLFVEDGRLFVPIRFVGEQLGAAVEWNGEEQTVLVESPIHDQIIFYLESKRVTLNGAEYIMDVFPLIRYERMYLPIRHVSELLHLEVKWNDDDNSIHLKTVPLYEVQVGESLASISEQFDTTAELIKVRNNLQSHTVHPETNLKVVIPYVIKNQNQDDILLLAKLIEAEAGSEPFNGQVAIGNVILNRVNDSRFPNTIENVITEVGQFTPVKTGKINSVVPSQGAIDAAKKALQGDKPVADSLYFFNRAKTTNQFLLSREVVLDIGNHRFTK